jgi:hypothetical protein
VRLPGVEKILSTKTIGAYYTHELTYYANFYNRIKRCGFPFQSFLEAPFWVTQLVVIFDGAHDEIQTYLSNKGKGGREK